jgi:hypothetical protein
MVSSALLRRELLKFSEELRVEAAAPNKSLPPPTFTDFKRRLYKRYLHPAHLELIDQTLAEVIRYIETGGREGIGYLIITWPPRHGKSFSLSRFFPAYFIATHPDMRVILASYAAHLTHKFSRQARNLFLAEAFAQMFPGVRLASDSKAADSWNVQGYEGGMDAVGILSGATGKGGQLIIGDDLLSGREAAESVTIRNKTWEIFTDDLYTRREPGGAVVLSGTHWHADDPIGRALKADPGKWKVLNLPAIAEDNDLLGRPPGEALWPERYPLDVLEDIRRTQGAYSFASLYQQRPTPREGGLFKWADINDHRVTQTPTLRRIVVAIDPAVTANADSDETGIIVAGLGEDGDGYILDDMTLSASPDAWARQAVAAYHKYKADRILAEVNNGGDMVEFTVRTVDANVSFAQVRASRGKIARAEPVAALYEQGKIHFVGTFGALEDEMLSMLPGMANSPDRVDAMVWALTELMLTEQWRSFVL